jgi:hypothetical protein
MRSTRLQVTLVAAVILVAACTGGGSSPVASVQPSSAAPSPAAAATSTRPDRNACSGRRGHRDGIIGIISDDFVQSLRPDHASHGDPGSCCHGPEAALEIGPRTT